MTFKKGEKILTDEGEMGEILYIDQNGSEAQVALAHGNAKLRTDSLRKFDALKVRERPVKKTRKKPV